MLDYPTGGYTEFKPVVGGGVILLYSSVLLAKVLSSLLKTALSTPPYLYSPSYPNVISPWPSWGLREDMPNIFIMHISIIVYQAGGGGGILDEREILR